MCLKAISGGHVQHIDLNWIHKNYKMPHAVTFLGWGTSGWSIWVCLDCHQGSTRHHHSTILWWDDECCLYFFLISLVSEQTIAILLSAAFESVQKTILSSLNPVSINLDIFLKREDKICSAHNIPHGNSVLTFPETDQTLKVTVHSAVIPQRGNGLSLGRQGDVS